MTRCPATWLALPLVLAAVGCSGGEGDVAHGSGSEAAAGRSGATPEEAMALRQAVARVDSAAAVADAVFQPLPLLRPTQESSLRAFGNAAQLERARALGVGRSPSPQVVDAHLAAGRLVRLEDTEHWVVGELDHSAPLVVPAMRRLMVEIGERFQARLRESGAPNFRYEVSSLLRTAADQESLRAVNANAAGGVSTHEYGATIDVLYSAFAAPAEPLAGAQDVPEWAQPFVERYADVAAERVAARRALELKAVLGEVLLELQREGRVMVTLERLQPVFHLTLASES